jgi:hypothetical protein
MDAAQRRYCAVILDALDQGRFAVQAGGEALEPG